MAIGGEKQAQGVEEEDADIDMCAELKTICQEKAKRITKYKNGLNEGGMGKGLGRDMRTTGTTSLND